MRGLADKVNELATTTQFADALEDAQNDQAEFGRLKADPRSYLRGKGVNIPRNVEVDFSDDNSWLVCFYYYYWYYRVQYCYVVS